MKKYESRKVLRNRNIIVKRILSFKSIVFGFTILILSTNTNKINLSNNLNITLKNQLFYTILKVKYGPNKTNNCCTKFTTIFHIIKNNTKIIQISLKVALLK